MNKCYIFFDYTDDCGVTSRLMGSYGGHDDDAKTLIEYLRVRELTTKNCRIVRSGDNDRRRDPIEDWMVTFYNEADDDFGFCCGYVPCIKGLTKSMAKSIARGLNRRTPDFITYNAEEEPEEWHRRW